MTRKHIEELVACVIAITITFFAILALPASRPVLGELVFLVALGAVVFVYLAVRIAVRLIGRTLASGASVVRGRRI